MQRPQLIVTNRLVAELPQSPRAAPSADPVQVVQQDVGPIIINDRARPGLRAAVRERSVRVLGTRLDPFVKQKRWFIKPPLLCKDNTNFRAHRCPRQLHTHTASICKGHVGAGNQSKEGMHRPAQRFPGVPGSSGRGPPARCPGVPGSSGHRPPQIFTGQLGS